MSELLLDLLNRGTSLIWPTQKEQELLFDLGERKSYKENERLKAVEDCVTWWLRWGVAPERSIPCEWASWPSIRSFLQLSDKSTTPGVAKGLDELTTLVEPTPKTLANNLTKTKWYQCHRPEHRWTLFLGRTLQGEEGHKGFLFHRRSLALLNVALGYSHGHLEVEQLDAADAMLLFNLVSHWQRRRPTKEVRGNRIQTRSRRETPKPSVGLGGSLLNPGLFWPNLRYLSEREASYSLCLLFEFALTEAHLGPHSQRSGSAVSTNPSNWLELIEEALKSTEVEFLLGEEAEHLRYRIDLMKAYRDGLEPPNPPASIAEHPYVSSALALSRNYWAKRNGHEAGEFLATLRELQHEEDWEGRAMQISQISRKLERTPE